MGREFKTPAVYRREIDLSDIIVPTGISNGAIVIRSYKGPVNRPVLVSNDKEFVDTFGTPIFLSGAASTTPEIPEYGYGHYGALQFLQESSNLYVVRSVDDGGGDKFSNVYAQANLASTSGLTSSTNYMNYNVSADTYATQNVSDKIDKIYSIDTDSSVTAMSEVLGVFANYPGEDGNNIAVTIEAFSSSADWKFGYDEYPASGSSGYASVDFPIANKVFKMMVYTKAPNKQWTDYKDKNTNNSETSGTYRLSPLETFYGTLAPTATDDNTSLFIEDVVNGKSKYIYVKAKSGATKFSDLTASTMLPTGIASDGTGLYVKPTYLLTLARGTVKQATGLTGDSASWDIFKNREETNIGILIVPTNDATTKMNVASVVAGRMDCIMAAQVASVTADNTVATVTAAELYGYVAPSYVALYCGYSKIYDKYNDKFLYIPNAIFGASLFARVDNIGFPWDAPAGINRAVLPVLDQKKIWSFDDIGKLYDANINSVRFIRGTGNVMWGQKTAQLKKSALDRINVRRMLLYVENNCEIALLPFVFENNTVTTRLRVFSIIDEFVAGVQAGGGVTAYKVVCDESNNTPQIIDQNRMNVDIYVQPTRTSEYIQLSTIITKTGISFESVRVAP